MAFRDKVKQEALQQKALRRQGKPIPPELKKYARLSGLFACLIAGIGSLAIFGIGVMTGTYYIAFILLFAVLALFGLIQLVSGYYLLHS